MLSFDQELSPSIHKFDNEFTSSGLSRSERRIVARLTTPNKIQGFLDEIAYSTAETNLSPLYVLRERMGNCFDGAVFAAAMLSRLGYPPLILDMLPNGRDDDHVVALYKRDGHWGAVAKSNFAGLRFREPIYRTIRELVMSYFEQFFNVKREKTLRAYTRPLNLRAFDKYQWMTRNETMEKIEQRLSKMRSVPLLTRRMIAGLSPVDERSYQAGLFGANKAGLYKPQHRLR
jgi:hypothetical protein